MEQLAALPQLQLQQQSSAHPPIANPPLYLSLLFLTLLGLSLISAAMLTLGRTTPSPSDPFAALSDIFPGQPKIAAEARGFSCSGMTSDYYENSPTEICSLSLPTGLFSQIRLLILQGVIRQISFTIRENMLRVGDLLLLFDQPEIRSDEYWDYFYWHNQMMVALAKHYTERYFLSTPVLSICFSNLET